jgi:Domain of unknown function (DUF4192)
VLTARGPGDLLAVIPYHFGFHPSESLVLLAVSGERRRLGIGMRVDLPPPEHAAAVADQVTSAARVNGVRHMVVVAYTAEQQTAQPLVEEVLDRLHAEGIDVVEALRADGERWFSYHCHRACCPAEGTPYDLSCHPLATEAVLQGAVALPDRSALERRVAAEVGGAAEEMAAAFTRAEVDLAELLEEKGASAAGVRADLVARMTGVVRDYVAVPRILGSAEAAELAVWATFIPVRDAAWTLMSYTKASRHRSLWEQVLRRVRSPYEPAVACLMAFAAWLEGNGALALCALDRARAADPDYSMASLIEEVVSSAVPPSRWDTFAALGRQPPE